MTPTFYQIVKSNSADVTVSPSPTVYLSYEPFIMEERERCYSLFLFHTRQLRHFVAHLLHGDKALDICICVYVGHKQTIISLIEYWSV
jgi:hypothetical protein